MKAINLKVKRTMKYFFFLLPLFFSSPLFSQNTAMQTQKIHALRLNPGDDLKLKLNEFVQKEKIEAGYILTCVGSLRELSLRLANQKESTLLKSKFEIVSLVGTLSPDGNHLHLSAADSTGKVIGGHLTEGNIIYTTAEIIIGESKDYFFKRETDSLTTFQELKIIKK